MFSKRNDKSGYIKEAEKNHSERGDLKKQNKGLQKGDRKHNVGNATGKQFQEKISHPGIRISSPGFLKVQFIKVTQVLSWTHPYLTST